jgi:CheY-like chemotaxis protein
MTTAPRLLIADDQETMRSVLKRLLTLEGYPCDVAINGRQALDALRQQKYALLLLDVAMPELDGIGVLHALRADPVLASLPVVMLTGNKDEEIRQQCEALGVAGFLTKPYRIADLLTLIRRELPTSA